MVLGASAGSAGLSELQPSSSSSSRGVRTSGLSEPMVAIMESGAEEMRKNLQSFKVCPEGVPENVDPSQAPVHADILIFGPSGSGKSSLIRTFYSAVNKTQAIPADMADRIIVKDTAMNEGTLKYISAIIKPPKHDHRGNLVSSGIMCHDTRGHIWMDEREQRQLSVMLDGHVKDDSLVQQRNYRYARLLWEFWKRDVDLFPPEILVRKNGLQTKPHALIFVFDGSMEEIPDGEEETRFYREIIHMARSKGYNYPQVVLTRIDRVEESLAKTAGASDDPELRLRQVLDRKIEDVVLKLEVSRSSVHFVENYHAGAMGSEGHNVAVEYHALKVLTQCLNNASTFISQSLRSPQKSPCLLQ